METKLRLLAYRLDIRLFVFSFFSTQTTLVKRIKKMGKTQEETMNNPFIPKDSELHALTRAEEENCYKDMKAKALEACQLPIKGIKKKFTWIACGIKY